MTSPCLDCANSFDLCSLCQLGLRFCFLSDLRLGFYSDYDGGFYRFWYHYVHHRELKEIDCGILIVKLSEEKLSDGEESESSREIELWRERRFVRASERVLVRRSRMALKLSWIEGKKVREQCT